MPFKTVDMNRPAGFDSLTTTQENIEQITDSELANKIEKTRTEVLKVLYHDNKGKQRHPHLEGGEGEKVLRPDPNNIDCPVCSLVSATGQRSVMTRIEEETTTAAATAATAEEEERDCWDTEAFIHDVYYFCQQCGTRIYRDDPAFEDLSHISPHDALEVVAINDPNSEDQKPIMVSKQNKFSKARRKQDYQGRLDKILDKLS